MKKIILIVSLSIFFHSNINAQHFKKDGTPDRRYTENKSQSINQNNNNYSIEHVDTYQKKDGTIIIEHNRTKKNNTDIDNWSTKPNINPETEKKGTKKPKK